MNNYWPSNSLLAREEGKIKTFESSTDLRSWSHDFKSRDTYLREWMKFNSRFRILPNNQLVKFSRIMTYKKMGKVSRRCHLDCKSKVVLDSICSSCDAMKLHLKSDENFEKYFEEEAFETSHWPCDQCMDALKSVRMFWKIIVEKVYNINFSLVERVSEESPTNSIRSLAESLKNNILKQANQLKSMKISKLSPTSLTENKSTITLTADQSARPELLKSEDRIVKKHSQRNIERKSENRSGSGCKLRKRSSSYKSNGKAKADSTESYNCIQKEINHVGISVRVKTVDFECNTDNAEKAREELEGHKNNMEYLQKRYNIQRNELKRLKKDNSSLKFELRSVYKDWMSPFYSVTPMKTINDHKESKVPDPFETCCESQEDADDVQSEINITMKKIQTEGYKNISLFQVVHKSNEPFDQFECNSGLLKLNTRDPMDVLSKMQNTFGEIVRREISVVKGKKDKSKRSDITASSHRAFKSELSRTAMSRGPSSVFMSSNETSENEYKFY